MDAKFFADRLENLNLEVGKQLDYLMNEINDLHESPISSLEGNIKLLQSRRAVISTNFVHYQETVTMLRMEDK